MSSATRTDSAITNPGGTGTSIVPTLSSHQAGDELEIFVANTGNVAWTAPAGWTRKDQRTTGTASTGLVGTLLYRRVLSTDTLPLSSPTCALGATVTRFAVCRTIRGADVEGIYTLPEWSAFASTTGTANPIRPPTVVTPAPEMLVTIYYCQRAATNAPEQTSYTQDREVVSSGTLVLNVSERVVNAQQTSLASQDASPTSGARWVAMIVCTPSPDYVYYRAGSQALTASGTSATPTLPTGTSSSDNRANKDLVVATIEAAGTPTISPQVGADWTEIAGWANTTSGNGSTIKKYWALYDGSLNLQFNRSTTGEIFVYLSTYRNTRQSSPIGSTAVQQNASSTSSAFPSLVRTATKVTIQITCIADGTPTYTSPSTWAERNDSNGVTCADQSFNATGTISSASFTLSTGSPTLAGISEIESVSSVGEFSGAGLIDGAGTISTSATFFSILTGQTAIDAAGAVEVSGARVVSRAVAIDAVGSIESAGTTSSPAATFERSAAVDATSTVEATGTFFSVFERVVTTDATGAIESSASFFSIFEGSALFDTSASIESTGTFFSTFTRSVSLDSAASIESSGQFFTTFQAAVVVDGVAGIETTAQFFSIWQAAIAIDGVGSITVAGQIVTGFTTHERIVSVTAIADISTITGPRDLLRSAAFNVLASITVSTGAPALPIQPKAFGKVGRENRMQSIAEENRRL